MVSPDVRELASLFVSNPNNLGTFTEIGPQEIPEPYRTLLNHPHHMTVTVERFNACAVNLRVLGVRELASAYSREILLLRRSDGQPVQYGIVRIHHACLPADVFSEIRRAEIPLGRILIHHGLLRHVELSRMWRIQMGERLVQVLGSFPAKTTTFGRTAWIHIDHVPAVELLEILAPVPRAE